MDVWNTIGLVGGIASIAGLVYAISYARQSRRVKLLVFDASIPVALATAVSPENDYKLSVSFQRGSNEEKIKSAHVRFVRFANLGKEPIRREDIAPANPLAVVVEGVRTLDISIAGVSRAVNKVGLSELSLSETLSRVEIELDFLDYQDGAVLKILTEGGQGTTKLTGDIIGMPSGIKRFDDGRPFRFLNAIGCSLGVIMELAALGLMVYTFYWVTGAWKGVWLLLLPFVALFAPALIFIIVATTIWPDQGLSFPRALAVPEWFHRLASAQLDYDARSRHGLIAHQNDPNDSFSAQGSDKSIP
jgi:hypothetical protein